jgi:large subunit ribosomal protein L2
MMIYYAIKFLKKKLIKGIKKMGGRCNSGRVTVRGQGGGNKKLYRVIDFYRRLNEYGELIAILYDPNRSSKLGLIIFSNSLSSFILIQKEVKIGSLIYLGTKFMQYKSIIQNGYSMPLSEMPLYSVLSNVEFKPFTGKGLCRAADTSCVLIGKTKNKGVLKLNSNWELHLPLNCISSYGSMSSRLLNNIFLKKAGKNRSMGFKPRVRGVAKNPCDHPHGGGNGKKPKPKIPVNAWHTVFKWKHTKNKKKEIKKRRLFKILS